MITKKIYGFIFLIIFTQTGFVQAQNSPAVNFKEFVDKKLKDSYDTSLSRICPVETEPVAARIFAEYGAIFVSENGVMIPGKCIFENEEEVRAFQNHNKIKTQTEIIGGIEITLQEPAMKALLEARKEAAQKKLNITPRKNSISAKRSFQDTVKLWNSRFYPALRYWVGKRKISPQEAEGAKTLQIKRQVAKVLEWETRGLYFSKDLSKSILYSVAAPGASQHIFLLALDVAQFADPKVRKILADHGWFQTVKSDLPHFTYLGIKEEKLPSYGLKSVPDSGQTFWIPNFNP